MGSDLKREDYLQRKIEPFNPSHVRTVEDALTELQGCSYQGRNLGTALEVITNMIQAPHCLRVLTLAGALIPAGMEELICQAIERKVIGAIVSTGANITHSIVNAADEESQAHYLGTDKVDDEELYKLHLNRIYDTYLPELAYWKAKEFFRGLLLEEFQPGEQYMTTPSELFKIVGSKLPGRSFLGVAAKNNVPVFCGATSDSEFGMDLALFRRNNNLNIVLNEMKDIQNFAAFVKSFSTWGTMILGGGVPRNWTQQVFPYIYVCQNLDEEDLPGYEYSVRFHSANVEDGGLSGCTISEGISWGKYSKDAKNISVWGEASVYFPLLLTALFQRMDRLGITLE
jgi:deoxyhypusine synthase